MNNTLSTSVRREVNIELLRVISMFGVLLIHYVPYMPQASTSTIANFNGGEMLSLFFHSLSVVSVNCFVLISGYFGIKWKKKSFCNFIFQIFFWYTIAALISFFVFHTDYKTALLGYLWIQHCWFIIAYLGLYALSPVLNAFIENSSEKKLLHLLIAFYTWLFLFGYIARTIEVNEGMSCISLIGLYFIGAYLKKASWVSKFSAMQYLLFYILCVLSLMFCSIVILLMGIQKSPLGYINPIVIVESVSLFMCCKSLIISEKWEKIVTFFSSSVFATFLFHYHGLISPYYEKNMYLL